MLLNDEDKIMIKNWYLFKNYGAKKVNQRIYRKEWKLRTLNCFLKKLRESGNNDRKHGSGRQQTIVDDAIDEWRARLRACFRARGGHFEHLL